MSETARLGLVRMLVCRHWRTARLGRAEARGALRPPRPSGERQKWTGAQNGAPWPLVVDLTETELAEKLRVRYKKRSPVRNRKFCWVGGRASVGVQRKVIEKKDVSK
eukprot:4838940-Pleurochrysis_carterae.AAC.3